MTSCLITPRIVFLSLLLGLFTAAPLHLSSQTHEDRDAAVQKFEKADKDLNRVYQKALDQLSPKGKSALKEAQRAWVVFRDMSAKAYGTQEEGGSNERDMYVACQTALTEARTKELTRMFLQEGYPW